MKDRADKRTGDLHRRIVKHSHDGRDPVSYEGSLVESHGDWIAIQATWVHGFYSTGCLTFHDKDILTEYFSERRPYNAFRVNRENGEYAGWYCNVTGPLEITGHEIHWHDLYLDVVLLPDSTIHLLDEDEFDRSGIANSDPQLHRYIFDARDELMELVRLKKYPFSTSNLA